MCLTGLQSAPALAGTCGFRWAADLVGAALRVGRVQAADRRYTDGAGVADLSCRTVSFGVIGGATAHRRRRRAATHAGAASLVSTRIAPQESVGCPSLEPPIGARIRIRTRTVTDPPFAGFLAVSVRRARLGEQRHSGQGGGTGGQSPQGRRPGHRRRGESLDQRIEVCPIHRFPAPLVPQEPRALAPLPPCITPEKRKWITVTWAPW